MIQTAKINRHALIPAYTTDTPLDILLVEDVASDALLLRLALDASRMPYRLRSIHNGDEVLPWLMQELKKGRQALPDVLLLDLGLPCMDGFEVLAGIAAARPDIRAIPIVILTGYEHFEYIRQSYDLCVTAYINKPCDSATIYEILARLRREKSASVKAC